MKRLAFAGVIAATLGTVQAHAQTYHCAVPRTLPRTTAELPSAGEPARTVPIGSYTLAITWAPQYCHEHSKEPSSRFECGSGNRFGFTLHGLWPDGEGATWPQYCAAAEMLPPKVQRDAICATPSAQLLQHEWAKHGTCMSGETPTTYFRRSNGLYAKLRYPDMNALSRRSGLTAGDLATAFARANPGMKPEMMRVTANKNGWLSEMWLCLNMRFAFVSCPSHQGGLAASAPLKIWRGMR